MKVLLLILFILASYHSSAATLYYSNPDDPDASLFTLTKTIHKTDEQIELVLTLKNATDEINGNGLEQIVEGIEIQYPLPPSDWIMLSDTMASQGKLEMKELELAMCQPAMLGRLKGFEKNNEALHGALATHFETEILPRMKPTLSYWLVGHTDTKGKASYNKALSLKRATALKQALTDAGFETRHITAFGEGENSPLTLEQDEASHELNRRVEIYPKQHTWAYWQLAEFRPDEEAELKFVFKPSDWAQPDELDTLLQDNSCYQLDMQHQYTVPTHAKLILHSRIQPAGKEWTQAADISACDGVTVELTVENHGARSARNLQLTDQLPTEWTLNKFQDFKQRQETQAQYLDWEQVRLYPNKSITLHYQIQAPYLNLNRKRALKNDQLCSEENYDNTFFSVGCLVAKQLQENVEPETIIQQHKATLTALGYPSVQAQNTLRWHTPSLQLQPFSPQIQFAGEKIEQTLIVTNNGDMPIRQLKIVAQLPEHVHSIEALNTRQQTDEQLIWMLGQLPPKAQQQVRFSFIPHGNHSNLVMTRFLVYDQVYGAKQCVRTDSQIQTLIKPLRAPKMQLKAERETVSVGSSLFYQVELKNQNPIDLEFTIQGQVDPRIWQQTRQVVQGIVHSAEVQKNIPLVISLLPSGELIVMHHGRKTMILPADGRLLFNFSLQAQAVAEKTLQALASNLASQFSVAQIQVKAVSHHELVDTMQNVMTVVYQ